MARYKTATRTVSNAGVHRVVGLFPSRKCAEPAACDSLLERDYFLLLDHDPGVVRFIPQPETIPLSGDPRWKRYTPDALVFFEDSLVRRVEVKHDVSLRKRKIVARLDAILGQYVLEGKEFQVVSSSEIRVGWRIENLRALRRYSWDKPHESSIQAAQTVLTQNPGIALNAAADQMAALGVDTPLATLYHLMFFQWIDFDLVGALIGKRTSLRWRPE